MSITLLQLRTGARQRSDMESSNLVSDSELTGYINSAIAELYDLLISAYDSDYNIQSAEFSTANGTATYALPNGTLYSSAPVFYKVRGVDVKLNGTDWFSVKKFNFNERNRNVDLGWGTLGGPSLRYRVVGSNLMFSPTPDGVYNVKLWYIPVATKLSADGDTLDDLNQFSEYVMVEAAIKMLLKEESDVSVLLAQKLELKQRIQEMAQNRDAGEPESVHDIYAENSDFYFSRD